MKESKIHELVGYCTQLIYDAGIHRWSYFIQHENDDQKAPCGFFVLVMHTDDAKELRIDVPVRFSEPNCRAIFRDNLSRALVDLDERRTHLGISYLDNPRPENAGYWHDLTDYFCREADNAYFINPS